MLIVLFPGHCLSVTSNCAFVAVRGVTVSIFRQLCLFWWISNSKLWEHQW